MSSDDKIVSLDIQEINLDVPSNPPQESFSIGGSLEGMSAGGSSLGDGIELLMNEKVKTRKIVVENQARNQWNKN